MVHPHYFYGQNKRKVKARGGNPILWPFATSPTMVDLDIHIHVHIYDILSAPHRGGNAIRNIVLHICLLL